MTAASHASHECATRPVPARAHPTSSGNRPVVNVWLALVWVVKLATDPLTDIVAYSPRYLRRS